MLSFEDWLKLSVEEKEKRYKDLSDRDKFLVRQGDYYEDNIIIDKNLEIEIPDFLKDVEWKSDNQSDNFKDI